MSKSKSQQNPLEFYLQLQYPIILHPDPDGGFVVEIKELPGCITQGETSQEALLEIADARTLWIKTAYEHGDIIPLPANESKYSGKTLLRMPRSLHQRLVEGAEREGVSLNQYLVYLLNKAHTSKTISNREKHHAL